MPKKIDCGVSSLIDLKAELFRKKELNKKSTPAAGKFPVYIKPTDTKNDLLRLDRDKKRKEAQDKEERKGRIKVLEEGYLEEERRLEQSRKILQAKANLYEKLKDEAEVVPEDSAGFLVNFGLKASEQRVQDELSDSDAELPSTSSSGPDSKSNSTLSSRPHGDTDDKWVEYTDAFGRTRTCLMKDLHKYIDADKRINESSNNSESINSTRNSDPPSNQGNGPKKFLDAEFSDGEEASSSNGPVHYQHILEGEAREHGVAYVKFSADEKERRKQMEELGQLRQETIDTRSKSDLLKEKRMAIAEARLAKVRERKKLRPKEIETHSSSEDDEKAPDPSLIPLPEESVAQQEEEAKAALARSKKTREWDRGKITDRKPRDVEEEWKPKPERGPMDQETWVKKRRTDRDSEFAPPTFNY